MVPVLVSGTLWCAGRGGARAYEVSANVRGTAQTTNRERDGGGAAGRGTAGPSGGGTAGPSTIEEEGERGER